MVSTYFFEDLNLENKEYGGNCKHFVIRARRRVKYNMTTFFPRLHHCCIENECQQGLAQSTQGPEASLDITFL